MSLESLGNFSDRRASQESARCKRQNQKRKSFVTDRPILVRIVSDYDISGLLRQTPGGAGMWDGISFTTRPVAECDLLVMLNNRKLDPVSARCAPGNVWAIMQEPYVPNLYDWLIEGHEPYARVFTHLIPSQDPKYVPSQPAQPWEVGLTYDELVAAAVPEKTRGVSWIASNLTFLPGHKRRTTLRRYLLEQAPDLVDFFGRGISRVARKWDVLAPYRFSLAIENSVGPHLWTEKVADCFLAWTVPLYDGCTNLEQYFPEDSFLRVDADNPAAVCATLEKLRGEQRMGTAASGPGGRPPPRPRRVSDLSVVSARD